MKKYLKRISTHLLTVLTTGDIVISDIEQYSYNLIIALRVNQALSVWQANHLPIVRGFERKLKNIGSGQEGRRNPYEYSKIYTEVSGSHQWM